MDARKFLFNSDYETPALVLNKTASMTVGKGTYDPDLGFIDPGFTDISIPHELPFIPLIIGQWSTNSNFEPCYDIGEEEIEMFVNGEVGWYPRIGISIFANDTNIEITGLNCYTNKSINLYFRITAFAPPDYYGDVTPIQDTSNFLFSTDFNYPKVLQSGVVSFTASDPDTKTIAHNLGYTPMARIWYRETNSDNETRVSPVGYVDPYYDNDVFNGAYVDKNNMVFGHAFSKAQYIYHIYGDEV